eukprot:scaffold286_cov247-Pinguiococcus_pyrenoidosus.AAC.9
MPALLSQRAGARQHEATSIRANVQLGARSSGESGWGEHGQDHAARPRDDGLHRGLRREANGSLGQAAHRAGHHRESAGANQQQSAQQGQPPVHPSAQGAQGRGHLQGAAAQEQYPDPPEPADAQAEDRGRAGEAAEPRREHQERTRAARRQHAEVGG